MIGQIAGTAWLIAVAIASVPASPAPLQPLGPWTVEAEDNLCLLTHAYGTADAKVIVGLQPLFTNKTMDVILISGDRNRDQRVGEGSLTLAPGGRDLKAQYVSLPLHDGSRRLTRFTVDNALMQGIVTAGVLRITAGKLDFVLHLASATKALPVLDACQRDLLTSWGVDPALVDKAHAPSIADESRGFNSTAYPLDALRAGISGRVVTVLQVDVRGRVGACRVVASSGAALNSATCDTARRLIFTPAHDDRGAPVASIYVLPVRWVLPSP